MVVQSQGRVRGGTMSLTEFLASRLADEEPAWEYFSNGRIARKASASFVHGLLQAALGSLLKNYLSAAGADAQVIMEVRAALPRSSPVPDLAVYRGRLRPGPSGELPKYAPRPPALVVEIVSPGQSRSAMVERCRAILLDGTEQALLVDPARREVVEVTAAGVATRRGADAIVFVVPELAQLLVTVDEVFVDLD